MRVQLARSTTQRVAGANRYLTNPQATVAQLTVSGAKPTLAIAATGENCPDALTAAAYVNSDNAVVPLLPDSGLYVELAAALTGSGVLSSITDIHVVCGYARVTWETE